MTADAIELDELKPIALKRKAVSDSDKVRYRVYTTPQEFVAVIAENALMALKVSGVVNPYRIVRDLPLAGNAIEPQRLTAHHVQPTAFIRPNKIPDAPAMFEPVSESGKQEHVFEPLGVASLSSRGAKRPLMLDVDMLLKSMGEVPVMPAKAEVESPAPSTESTPEPAQDDALSSEEIDKLLNEPRA